MNICLFFFVATAPPPNGLGPFTFTRFLDHTHTQRRTTFGKTPLDEWSARRTDLYLKTPDTHNRQTSMPPVGFEHTMPASERAQTHALDCASTGNNTISIWYSKMLMSMPGKLCDSTQHARTNTHTLTWLIGQRPGVWMSVGGRTIYFNISVLSVESSSQPSR